MAEIKQHGHVTAEMTIKISEAEARALDALSGYGDDAFIKHFKENLGTAYMRDHEAGLREFLSSVRGCVSGFLSRIDKARAAFNGKP